MRIPKVDIKLSVWLIGAALFLLAAVYFELKNIHGFFSIFALNCVAIIFCVPVTFLQRRQKAYLMHYLKIALIVIVSLTGIHFTFNSIDFYRFFSPPALFYTFKLHRFITLSGVFWLEIVSFLGTSMLASTLLRFQSQKKQRVEYLVMITVLIYLSLVMLTHAQLAVGVFYRDSALAILNSPTPFADRFTFREGGISYYGWIWPYTRFINKFTPENATILIPPQALPWKMEGNPGYLRWFIYPRKTIVPRSYTELPESADVVLIALGECNEGDCGWPKFSIPKDKIEYIALISRDTLQEEVITNQDYYLDKEKFKWGVIKLKK